MSDRSEYPLEDVAAFLALARNDVGLSSRALADRAGVDESGVVEIESGASAAGIDRDVLAALFIAAELRPAVPLGY